MVNWPSQNDVLLKGLFCLFKQETRIKVFYLFLLYFCFTYIKKNGFVMIDIIDWQYTPPLNYFYDGVIIIFMT